jgi:hypothetical protein
MRSRSLLTLQPILHALDDTQFLLLDRLVGENVDHGEDVLIDMLEISRRSFLPLLRWLSLYRERTRL